MYYVCMYGWMYVLCLSRLFAFLLDIRYVGVRCLHHLVVHLMATRKKAIKLVASLYPG